jgi:hypothetical protein
MFVRNNDLSSAQDKLVVSVWGGSWRDMVANIIAKKFTAETSVQVEYITGGTIDRRHHFHCIVGGNALNREFGEQRSRSASR